jgi:small subunit ribosomal protein S15
MGLDAQAKADVVKKYQRFAGDTGSPEVQVALMSARIEELTQHFKTHTHDLHSRQGLLRLINKRRRLLDYMKRVNVDGYRSLIAKLGLRK